MMTNRRRVARVWWAIWPCALVLGVGVLSAQTARPLKVFISVDMEGVTGVVQPAQLLQGGFEYEHFRQIMTDETNAAIEGARSAGATEFIVCDSHGNAQNILIDQLPDDVRIVRGMPRPLSVTEGIMNAGIAGQFGVPVVFVSGDQIAVETCLG